MLNNTLFDLKHINFKAVYTIYSYINNLLRPYSVHKICLPLLENIKQNFKMKVHNLDSIYVLTFYNISNIDNIVLITQRRAVVINIIYTYL